MISVKLSKRLLAISKYVKKGTIVYDVGSDHALLPCYLIQNKIAKKVYAGDNKIGPLNSAIENIKKYHLEDKVIPILQDGIKDEIDDIEVIIISGMGFYTIKKILDKANLKKYQYFIVEANKDVEKLRKYLSDHHLTIKDESVIFDELYYQIIVFNNEYIAKYNDLEIKYGPILLKKKEQIFKEFLLHERDKINNINIGANNKYLNKVLEINSLLKNWG